MCLGVEEIANGVDPFRVFPQETDQTDPDRRSLPAHGPQWSAGGHYECRMIQTGGPSGRQ